MGDDSGVGTPETEIPPPPWRRRRRTVPARRPLSQELIVEAALHVLDAEGFDALSMRRLAGELGTGPASLYAYVSNKDELLELLVDRVAGEIVVPEPDPRRWREQIKEVARESRRVWTEHSGIARAAMASVPVGPNSLRLSEGLLAILRAGGVPDQAAAWMLDALGLYLNADAFEASLHAERGRRSAEAAAAYYAQIHDYYAGLPPERFPNITSMVGALMAGSDDERFEFTIDLMVRGLESHLEGERAGTT